MEGNRNHGSGNLPKSGGHISIKLIQLLSIGG